MGEAIHAIVKGGDFYRARAVAEHEQAMRDKAGTPPAATGGGSGLAVEKIKPKQQEAPRSAEDVRQPVPKPIVGVEVAGKEIERKAQKAAADAKQRDDVTRTLDRIALERKAAREKALADLREAERLRKLSRSRKPEF
jgi:hypothetical protein